MVAMHPQFRAFSTLVAAALVSTSGLTQAQQKFPTKPIRFVVPFSPGGSTDTLARLIAQKMSESWGQAVVMENRTGAGGTIGTSIVAKATPDGHTLLVSSSAFAITAERGFWARPEIRIFLTSAIWNEAARGATVDSGRLYTATSYLNAYTFGLQGETWW